MFFSTGDDFPNMEALLETVFELSASHQGSARLASSGEPSPVNTGTVHYLLSQNPLSCHIRPRGSTVSVSIVKQACDFSSDPLFSATTGPVSVNKTNPKTKNHYDLTVLSREQKLLGRCSWTSLLSKDFVVSSSHAWSSLLKQCWNCLSKAHSMPCLLQRFAWCFWIKAASARYLLANERDGRKIDFLDKNSCKPSIRKETVDPIQGFWKWGKWIEGGGELRNLPAWACCHWCVWE